MEDVSQHTASPQGPMRLPVSLRTRLIAANILIIAVSIASLGYYVYYRGQQTTAFLSAELDSSVRQKAVDTLTASVTDQADTLNNLFASVRKDVAGVGLSTNLLLVHEGVLGSEIQSGARHVTIDDRYDPDSNPLKPGTSGLWPVAPGKAGSFDLSRPEGTVAALACLHDFDSPWASIRRLDDSVGAALSWDSGVFPYVWLWYELGGTPEPPWCGKARLIGLEPNTTWPANGLADASRRGGRHHHLTPPARWPVFFRMSSSTFCHRSSRRKR